MPPLSAPLFGSTPEEDFLSLSINTPYIRNSVLVGNVRADDGWFLNSSHTFCDIALNIIKDANSDVFKIKRTTDTGMSINPPYETFTGLDGIKDFFTRIRPRQNVTKTFAGLINSANGVQLFDASGNYIADWTSANWTGTVYPLWETGDYATVKFDTDGGTAVSDLYHVSNIGACTTTDTLRNFSELTIPTKAGYVFAGFTDGTNIYIDHNGNKLDTWDTHTFDSYYGSEVTLTAVWSDAGDMVELELNKTGGTGGSANYLYEIEGVGWSVDSTGTSLLPEPPKMPSGSLPTKTGEIFGGYYTEETGGIQVVNHGGDIVVENTFFDADTTLYAHWVQSVPIKLSPKTPSSSYNRDTIYHLPGNGGAYRDAECTRLLNDIDKLNVGNTLDPPTAPEGYVFAGYYYYIGQTYVDSYYKTELCTEEANWTLDAFDSGTVTLTARFKLTVTVKPTATSPSSQWKNLYLVYQDGWYTDDGCNNKCINDQLPSGFIPDRLGYTFKGCVKSSSGSLMIDSSYKIVASKSLTGNSIVFYGQWETITYEITLDPDGGTGLSISKLYQVIIDDSSGQTLKVYKNSAKTVDFSSLGTSGKPSKTGYTFEGFYREYDDGSSKQFITGGSTSGIKTSDWNVANAFSENGVLKAHYTPNQYTIKFDLSGIAATTPSNIPKTYGTNLTTLASPSNIPVGLNFKGWYTSTGTKYTGDTDLTSTSGATVTLYAHWGGIKYWIQYDTCGHATAPAKYEKSYSVSYTPPTTLAGIEVGYEFDGWYTDNTYTTLYTGNTDLSTEDASTVTVFARYKAKITYSANGHGTAPAAVSIHLNSTTTLPNISDVVTGYTFDGWYAESTCSTHLGNAGDSYTVTEPKTLYAKWTPIEYKLIFNLQGVAATHDPYKMKTYGQPLDLENPTSAPSGYAFLGWYREAECTTSYDGQSDISTTAGEEISLFAKWKQQVVFDANGHGTAPAPIDVISGDITLPDITCVGYTFGGWYKEAGCTNFVGNAGSAYIVTAPITLFAKWTAISYSIHFDLNGVAATAIADMPKTYGEALTSLPTPIGVPTGYEFVAWYKESTFANEFHVDDELSTTAGDVKTVYAKWNVKITYNTNGHGTVTPTEVLVALNGQVNLQSVSAVTGYTNDGKWYKESACTILAGNMGASYTASAPIELFLKWTENEYTITYVLLGGQWITAPSEADTKRLYTQSKTLLTSASLSRYGFDFAGWYENEGCTGSAVTEVAANTDANKTYYAKWNFSTGYLSVSFDSHGGSHVYELAVLPNETVTAPANPTRSGYTFAGWYKESEYTNQFDFATPITENITLHAKWNENQPEPQNNHNNNNGGGSSSGGGSSGASIARSGNLQNPLGILNNQNNQNGESGSYSNYYYEGPATNEYIKLYKNVSYINNVDGSLSALDELGNYIEGFCRLYDPQGNEQCYFFTEDYKMYCGYVKDITGTIYHFNDNNGQLDKMIKENGTEVSGFSGDGTNANKRFEIPKGTPMIEALKDAWQYDPLTNSWKFSRVSSSGTVAFTCTNGVYEIGEGNEKRVYSFDATGKLMTGRFTYLGQNVYASEDDNYKGSIIGIVDSNGNIQEATVYPNSKLKKTRIVVS